MRIPDDDPVASPCVSICRMDPGRGSKSELAAGGLCVGCLRTLDEIIAWGAAPTVRKREIAAAAAARRVREARGRGRAP